MTNSDLYDSFRNLEKELEKEHAVRDLVREAVRELEATERELTVMLQAIHRHADEASLQRTCENCSALIEGQLRVKIHKLASTIPEGEYFRFSDHFRNTAQRIVFNCAITHFLRTGLLITRAEVDAKLGIESGLVKSTVDSEMDASMKNEKSLRFSIDLEDFLSGLLMLASELSRFAVNAVTSGDYDRPARIAQLLADVDAGFRLLTLKNDALRRRYDTLKYELKKVEETVYDVSIRRLAQKSSSST